MASTTNVIEGLKYTYGVNKVLYLFNQESPTWKLLGKVKKPVGGRGQFIMPAFVQNGGAFTGITQGGALPTALQPDTAEATFSLQEYVALYDVTWKLIQDASKDKFAFQQAIQMLDEGLKKRIFRNLNSDLVDNGKGRLAVMSAADNDTVITVNSLPRCETGMVCDVMDLTDDDTKLGDSRTINGVDVINRTITISGAALSGTAAGDYFVIQDTCDATSQSPAYHSHGWLSVVSNANPAAVTEATGYGGLSRSTAGQEFWQSFLLSGGGTNRALTEDLLLQAMDGVREKGGGKLNAWISNLAIVRRYHELLASERYFALSAPGQIAGGIGRKEKDPGETGLTPYEFSGVPWYADPYFNANVIIGADTNHFFLGVGDNDVPRPISEVFDNVPFFRQTANATFEVAWYYQMELLSDNPAAGVQIQDVAES
mgnify:CR=1 FL=1